MKKLGLFILVSLFLYVNPAFSASPPLSSQEKQYLSDYRSEMQAIVAKLGSTTAQLKTIKTKLEAYPSAQKKEGDIPQLMTAMKKLLELETAIQQKMNQLLSATQSMNKDTYKTLKNYIDSLRQQLQQQSYKIQDEDSPFKVLTREYLQRDYWGDEAGLLQRIIDRYCSGAANLSKNLKNLAPDLAEVTAKVIKIIETIKM
jgi:uncharacterized phage infection (PIP) family protein YhgE